MPRIRTIKPDLWQDEAIGEISLEARLTFVGLITQADDHGRLKGSPKLVKAWVFPYDETPLRKVSEWLRELHESGLIICFKVEGRDFIELPSWKKHQRVSHPTDSALPSHSEADSTVTPEHSGGFRKPPEEPCREGKGREGRGGEREADSSGKPSEFDSWLAHYRQTTGKESVRGSKPARTAFAARLKDGYSLEDLKAATVGCHSDDFCRNNGHDVPETILRAGKVERYIALASEAKPPPSRYDAKTEVLAA
jgi:hypothetical protein